MTLTRKEILMAFADDVVVQRKTELGDWEAVSLREYAQYPNCEEYRIKPKVTVINGVECPVEAEGTSMTTDRDLLELAAKAVGFKFAVNGDDLPGYVAASNGDWRYGWVYWNPLIDDGAALRLAIRLHFGFKDFSCQFDDMPGFIEVWREKDDDPLYVEWYKPGDDRFAATRRAITRAAAELGRMMT